jgi:hypothetical protein
VAARREAFTLDSFDRLRVLTTELKRLIAAGAPVALRLGVGPALDESRLAMDLKDGFRRHVTSYCTRDREP